MTPATITSADFRWLYIHAFYDHPLHGEILWNGKRYWMQAVGESHIANGKMDEDGEPLCTHCYTSHVYDLPPDVWALVDERREDFIRWVGDHWVVREDGTRGPYDPLAKPRGSGERFWLKYPVNAERQPTRAYLKTLPVVAVWEERYE